VWLALAAKRLFEAKGLGGLPLAASVRALVGYRRVSRAALLLREAQSPPRLKQRIDYWIRRHVIPYCHGTSQSQIKFNSARDRRVGLSAIGQGLKDQYDAVASPMPRHLAALAEQLETQR
jgi:hypothetical protein